MLIRQIQLSLVRDGQSRGVRSGQTPLSSQGEIDVDERPKIRTRAIKDLLRRIVITPFTPVSHRTNDYDGRSTLPQILLRVSDWTQPSAEPCGALISQLDRVDLLERKGVEL